MQAQQALTQAQEAVAAAQAAARGGAGRGGGRGAAPGGGRAGQAAARGQTSRPFRRWTGSCRRPSPATTSSTTSCSARQKFAEIKARAEKGETLAPATIPGVKITVNIDNTYEVITTQLSKNVVGMIEGSDPKLKDTYVLFGSHLDHVGYRPSATGRGATQGGHAGPDLQRR